MKFVFAVLTMVLAQSVFAHPEPFKISGCGPKECSKESVEKNVPIIINTLVKRGDLEQSWTTAKVDKVEKKVSKDGSEYMIALNDTNQKNPSESRLYIFVDMDGHINGSNHTGE